MKRILSFLLAAIMLVSTATMTLSAEDELYMDADFSSDSAAGQDFYVGNFKSESGVLAGYSDAKAFQSKQGWSSYDVSWEVAFAEDESAPVNSRWFSYVYINPNMKHNGIFTNDYNISLVFDIDNGELLLCGGTSFGFDSENVLAGPVPCDMDTISGSDFYTFGMSVSEGRIRIFLENECIMDFIDEDNKYYIGYSYEEVEPSIMLWWNENNCVMFNDIKVSAPGYLYPIPETKATFSLEAAPVYEGDTEITVDVIATLPENATGYELGGFGLNLGYDNTRMSIKDEGECLIDGTFVFSEDASEYPYRFIWTTAKEKEQLAPGPNTVARITYTLAEPAAPRESFEFSVAADRENGVLTMGSPDGTYEHRRYGADEVSFIGTTVEATPIYDVILSLEAEPVCEGDSEINVNLVATLPENATGYELGAFGLELTYDFSEMNVSGDPEWLICGHGITSEGMFDIPYRIIWVSIDEADRLASGDNVIAKLTFKLDAPAALGDEYSFGLAIDGNNGICSMPSKDGTYQQIVYNADDACAVGTSVIIEKSVIYGDANSDEAVNISDISLILKHIAKWENLTIDTVAADVTADGNVNLSDISAILKHIAKWEGIVLGPQ